MITKQEKEVLNHLCEAFNKFKKLPVAHPDDMSEFIDGIHKAQNIIAFRVARRVNPKVWA
jgi:hypothetical protein